MCSFQHFFVCEAIGTKMRGGNLKKIGTLLLSLLLIFSACSNKTQGINDTQDNPLSITSDVTDENSDIENIKKPDLEQNTSSSDKSTETTQIEPKQQTQQKSIKTPQLKTDEKKAQKTITETEKKDTVIVNEVPKVKPVEQKPIVPSDTKEDIVTGATQNPDAPIATEQNVVTISIEGDEKTILDSNDIEFKTGDTVFDILLEITKSKKIHMDFSGSKDSAYVKGIDNLYEFDKGPSSGWKYTVNGVYPAYSAGDYEVEKGDVIKWIYVK